MINTPKSHKLQNKIGHNKIVSQSKKPQAKKDYFTSLKFRLEQMESLNTPPKFSIIKVLKPNDNKDNSHNLLLNNIDIESINIENKDLLKFTPRKEKSRNNQKESDLETVFKCNYNRIKRRL